MVVYCFEKNHSLNLFLICKIITFVTFSQVTSDICEKDILVKSVLRYYSCHRKSPVFKTVQVIIQQNALVFCLYPFIRIG